MTAVVSNTPEYTHPCKYCHEVTITLRLEEVRRGQKIQQRWIARSKNTGEIHNCITGRY
jgi:hypothetical protein